jgi:hypothetical protein
MKHWFKFRRLFFFGLVIVLISVACQLPLVGNKSQEPSNADLQATITALQTEMAKGIAGDQENNQPVVTEEQNTQLTEDVPPPSSEPDMPDELYRGFMVNINGHFISYDFNGIPLGFDAETIAENWISDNEVSVFNDQVYFSEFGENSGVFRVTQQGAQKINFINADSNPVSISVSPDLTQIAWSTSEWIDNAPQTDLFMSNLDGSDQRLISQIPSADQSEFWRIYHPYGWTSDGKLIYATGLTGIGGYLLFWGYNGLFVYDPLTNVSTTLVPDEERLGLCLSSVSDDLSMVAIVCGDQPGVKVRNLNNGSETSYPVLADQGTAGSAKFSPSGEWLAYVIQRVNPDDELGKVVVVPVDGSAAPQIIAEQIGTFTVEGWLDENSFLVTRSDIISNISTIWRMNRDGSDITQLTDGQFLGFIR